MLYFSDPSCSQSIPQADWNLANNMVCPKGRVPPFLNGRLIGAVNRPGTRPLGHILLLDIGRGPTRSVSFCLGPSARFPSTQTDERLTTGHGMAGPSDRPCHGRLRQTSARAQVSVAVLLDSFLGARSPPPSLPFSLSIPISIYPSIHPSF